MAAPLLPVLLLARQARAQAGKRATFGKFLLASPVVFLLLMGWSLGEALGYLTAEP
jgi:hypothetical protein